MEGRGLTLRSKSRRQRPQISAPKPISGPLPPNTRSPESGPSAIPTRERAPQNDATSDLVKRRYSTRFNGAPEFDSNAPPVPALPTQVPGGRGGLAPAAIPRLPSPADPNSPAPKVDLNALRDPSLPVDRYVAGLLANASEEDIQKYQESLRKVKNRTSTDLQQNVYQNRTQFIKISKEAEKLKDEMRTLRTLMAELTTALGQTSVGNSPNPMSPMEDSFPKRNANRSSVANLEIEGSQKWLPAAPGRHIVLETGNWVELDSATWKPRRPVHIVLLNDYLLVAAKKRKRVDQSHPNHRGPVPTRLVAEDCWLLNDIDMIDLGANLGTGQAREEALDRGIGRSISIRVGSKPFTYRHDDVSAKQELLATFRKTVEDLRRTMRSETEAASKPLESYGYMAGRHISHPKKPEAFELSDTPRDKSDLRIDVDGKQQNLRWVEGQVDELDIDIALQRFEASVFSIERLRKLAKGLKGNTIAQDVINFKVDGRATRLAGILSRALVDKHSFPVATKTHVTWLTRACIFEGDLPLYIFQISYVYFTLIKNTISIYQQCFPSVMSSSCIRWAKHHLDGFNALLSRQLSSVQRGTSVWQKCLDIVHDHAALLVEVGVDFTDLVARGLEENGEGSFDGPRTVQPGELAQAPSAVAML
ncbi:Vacuolar protein sorting-associated protein 51 [Penicillium expansum]|uniref:Exocyst complex component EXO84 n=1 Tax=Penicillium expansum TaxID=27334 RepID=A0A0A2IBC0_PENEN|nr:Vacuolar protein sorting-associated protein 51 [Penicillium expansum]KGO37610.1 Vacuolar protein sorting-associated protein 51 [Penicillium expansum]KGO63312.1 Vacuolar protein sorting-associated protein 51 [Penicillium expansum]KGO65508.1 Vacuolar protein sorting-associated protein 51 [Penicillium expansum]